MPIPVDSDNPGRGTVGLRSNLMRPFVAAFLVLALVGCRGLLPPPAELPPEEDGRGLHRIPDYFHVAQHSEVTCGAAVVAGVLSYWGTPSSSDEVAAATLKPGSDGIVAKDLQAYVQSKGYVGVIFEGTYNRLMDGVDKGRPIIVGTINVDRTFHYLTVIGYHDRRGYFLVDDPARGVRQIGFDEFTKIWGGAHWFTLLVAPDPKAAAAPDPIAEISSDRR